MRPAPRPRLNRGFGKAKNSPLTWLEFGPEFCHATAGVVGSGVPPRGDRPPRGGEAPDPCRPPEGETPGRCALGSGGGSESGLDGCLRKSWRGPPPQPALKTIVCPSGAKRAE